MTTAPAIWMRKWPRSWNRAATVWKQAGPCPPSVVPYTLTVTSQPLPTDVDLTMGGELPHDDTINGYLAGSPLEYQTGAVGSRVRDADHGVQHAGFPIWRSMARRYRSLMTTAVAATVVWMHASAPSWELAPIPCGPSQVSGQSGLFTLTSRVESQNLQERLQGLTALRPGASHSARAEQHAGRVQADHPAQWHLCHLK